MENYSNDNPKEQEVLPGHKVLEILNGPMGIIREEELEPEQPRLDAYEDEWG